MTKRKQKAKPTPRPFICDWQCVGAIREGVCQFRNNGQNTGIVTFGAATSGEGNFMPDAKLPFPPKFAQFIEAGMTLKIRVEVFA